MMTTTPKRDAWLDAQAKFDAVDRDPDANPSDEEYDALEAAADRAKADFLASGEDHLYEAWDDGGATLEISASSMEEAVEEAESWCRGGDWLEGGDDDTYYITVRVRDLATDDEDEVTVTIEPEEPECEDGEDHDWQSPIELVGGVKENPGVWGHGGGVRIYEVCMRCGCGRLTDTWAQNPSNGEQGLTSVKYTPGQYSDELERLANEEASC